MKKRIVCVLLALIMAFSVMSGGMITAFAENKTSGLLVGFCASDSTNPVFIEGEQNLRKLVEEDGNKLMVQYYETDAAKFIDICENFMAANCDIIIVQDPDEQISEDVLSRAKEQGILVCTLDTDNKNATYVQKDQNVEASHILAQDVIKFIKEEHDGVCKIVSVDCPQSEVLRTRCETALADIMEACPECEVVLTTDVWNVNADWVGVGETALQAAPDAYCLFCMADIVALGVNEAYKSAGKTAADGYAIFGYDALDAVVEEIAQKNIFRSTISLGYPEIIGKLYESAIGYMETGEVGERYVSAEMFTINQDNVDEYLAKEKA